MVFVLLPAAAALALSFTEWSLVGVPRAAGTANYSRMWADPSFRRAVANTLLFTVLTVPLLCALGLSLALLLDRTTLGARVAKLSVFAPTVVMVPVVGILWRWIFDTNFGAANAALDKLGLPGAPWLTSPTWALPSVAVTTVWWTVGTNALIYLAGLRTLPRAVLDAAALDGASAWQRLRHVTLPMLTPVHAFVVPMSVIASLRIFGQVYVMTQGGPYGHTYTLVQHLYKTGFADFRMGEACAVAVVLFSLTLALTLAQLRLLRSL